MLRQKAPSAKRCIKTHPGGSCRTHHCFVRKHRAPKGALRRFNPFRDARQVEISQKAPSAKRCIKTTAKWFQLFLRRRVRKHRAPKGALRPLPNAPLHSQLTGVRKHRGPKGTLRPRFFDVPRVGLVGQKAPSAKRCIKTAHCLLVHCSLDGASESTERQTVH